MITNPNPGENGSTIVLTVRTERPIQGCELNPNPFLQLKGGTIDNAARARLLDPNNVYYTFLWSRGPRGSGCLNENCTRGNVFDPLHWSKAALGGGPALACSECISTGYSLHESVFCCKACFVTAWKEHRVRHGRLRKGTSLSEISDSPNDDEEGGEDKPAVVESNKNNNCADGESLQVGEERMYVPSLDDVGCRLRLEVRAYSVLDNTLLAGPTKVVTDPVLSAPIRPPKRNLQTIPGASGSGMSGAVRFRVAYPYVDAWNLSWPYRRRLLFDELEEAQGDIVCLQEVQADHFESDVNPFMVQLGYDGVFKQKSREGMGSYGKVDGCATFWKKSKFIMTENYGIEFNDMARQEASTLGFDENDARRYMNRLNRDNIAQIVILESLSRTSNTRSNNNNNNAGSRNFLCIVNTHLYSNHQGPDVKLWQTINLIREIQQFVATREMPLMICGDFNSEPASAVYEYISQGAITHEYPEFHSEDRKVRILPDMHQIVHNLELASAMHTAFAMEPVFTNYTAKFKGTLDYIFYTPSRLRILAVTGIPEEHEIQSFAGEGLPCACYPSDHILLCCDVAMILSGNGSIFTNGDPNGAAMSVMSVANTTLSSPPLNGMSGPSTKSSKNNRNK